MRRGVSRAVMVGGLLLLAALTISVLSGDGTDGPEAAPAPPPPSPVSAAPADIAAPPSPDPAPASASDPDPAPAPPSEADPPTESPTVAAIDSSDVAAVASPSRGSPIEYAQPIRPGATPQPAPLPSEVSDPLFGGRVLTAGAGLPGATVSLLKIPARMLEQIPEGMRGMWLKQMKAFGGLGNMLQTASNARSDAEGRFLLPQPSVEEGDAGDGEVWLQVRHPDYQPVLSHSFRLASHPREVEVTLVPGGEVAIVLRAPDGSAFDGSQSTARLDFADDLDESVVSRGLAFSLDSGSAATTLTHREDGSLLLTGVPGGRHTLKVKAEGYREATREVDVAGGGSVTVTIDLEEGLSLSGHVRNPRGEAVVGANVWAHPLSGGFDGSSAISATSGEDGSFELRGLEDRTYAVNAHAQGHAQERTPRQVRPSGQESLEIVLSPTMTVSGRVVIDPSGEPGAGLALSARSTSGYGYGAFTGASVSGEDGSFQLSDLGPGTYTIEVEGKGYTTLDRVKIELRDEDLSGLEIHVSQGAQVEVWVLDRSGQGIEGAALKVTGAGEGGAMAFGPWGQRPDADAPTSDAQGRAQVEGLAPGEYQVQANHEDYASATAPFLVTEGEAPEPVRLELAPAASISGLLLDTAGQPAGGQMLMAVRGGQEGGGAGANAWQHSAATDDAGRFTIGRLVAGRYRIQGMAFDGGGGGMRQLAEVELAEGEQLELELSLDAQGQLGSIQGLVRQGTQPQSGAQVFAVVEGRDFSQGYGWGVSDAQGGFLLEDLEPGRYEVSTGGADPQLVEVTAGGIALLELEMRAGVVAGRVLGLDGQPAQLAQVRLARVDAGSLAATEGFGLPQATDGAGRFSLDQVRPGRYRLVATKLGVGASQGVELTLGADESRTGLELRLAVGGAVELTVQRADGQPAVGVQVGYYHVGLKMAGQQLTAGWGEVPATDRAGEYLFEELVPGSHVFYATSTQGELAVLEGLIVGDGDELEAELRLTPGAGLVVRAPPRSRVELLLAGSSAPVGSSGNPWAAFNQLHTDGEGLLRLSDLPAVELRVQATTPEGRELAPWQGTPPAGGELEITLE